MQSHKISFFYQIINIKAVQIDPSSPISKRCNYKGISATTSSFKQWLMKLFLLQSSLTNNSTYFVEKTLLAPNSSVTINKFPVFSSKLPTYNCPLPFRGLLMIIFSIKLRLSFPSVKRKR